ncbi:MAG: PaaX family transcriptional regulator C-terminal domain-containing protein [Roseibium sp.]
MPKPDAPVLDQFLDPFPPKAAQLIVTIYGDIVEPRGGVLWMGDLITLCAGFGVNESLVRTAVSRLVTRKQLNGERAGRRSFYGLTASARREFHSAAELFFGPADSDCALIFLHQDNETAQEDLLRQGFAGVGGNMFVGSDRPGRKLSGTRFEVSGNAGQDGARGRQTFFEKTFQLETLAAQYDTFIRRFEPLESIQLSGISGEMALTLRLALVHSYRAIRFIDPRLPVSVLAEDWPGTAARNLFADTYGHLSELVDSFIGDHLHGRDGPLAPRPAAVLERLGTMNS